MHKKELSETLAEIAKRYCDLVWYARKTRQN